MSSDPKPAPGKQPPLSVEQWLTGIVMAAILLITLANVAVRYFTDQSFAATEEFSIALLLALAFVGSATAFAHDRHIRVTFFIEALPAPLRRAADLLTHLATLAFFAFLAWYSARLTWDQYRFEETSPALGLPQWWYTVWMPILSAAIVLRLLWTMLRRRK